MLRETASERVPADGARVPEELVRIAETSGQAFWAYERHPLRRVYLTVGAEALWESSRGALFRDPLGWIGHIDPADRGRVAQRFDEFLRGATGEYDQEYRVVANGRKRFIRERGLASVTAPGGLVVGVACDVTEARRIARALSERHRFEELVTRVASEFMERPVAEVGAAIDRALPEFAELLRADRVTVWTRDEDETGLAVAHEWSRAQRPVPRRRIPVAELSWTTSMLARGLPVVVEDPSAVPEDAPEHALMKLLGVAAFVSAPIAAAGTWLGRVTFASSAPQRWSPVVVAGARAVGELLATGLMRQRAETRVRQLSARVLDAQAEEQRRLGRELHDGVGQTLTAAMLELTRLERLLPNDEARTRAMAIEARALCEQASRDIRTISHLLRPAQLDRVGLADAVWTCAEGFSARSGVRIDIHVDPSIGRLAPDAELALFRVLQEVLTNIHRHAGSSTASIRLARVGPEVMLEVRDRGRGIRGAAEGVGMTSMRERVEAVGGRLEIESSERGTIVRARVPEARP